MSCGHFDFQLCNSPLVYRKKKKKKLGEIKALKNSYACSQPSDQSRRLMDAIKGLYRGFDFPSMSSRGSSTPEMLLNPFDYAKTCIPLIGHW